MVDLIKAKFYSLIKQQMRCNVQLAHRIWRHAVRSLGDSTVKLSGLSEAIDVRIATLWTYHHGKARWPADTLIDALISIGGASIVDGKLIIPIPELDEDFVQSREANRERSTRKKSRRHADALGG